MSFKEYLDLTVWERQQFHEKLTDLIERSEPPPNKTKK